MRGRAKEDDIRFTLWDVYMHVGPAAAPSTKKKNVSLVLTVSHTQLALVKNPSVDGWGWPTL